MSAASNTTERGPKTTPRAKAPKQPKAQKPEVLDLAYWKAKKHAQVDSEHEAALAASEGFPALRRLVDLWLPQRRAEADLEAVHSDLEERGADAAEIDAANERWLAAMDATREHALAVLDMVALDPRDTMAKVATFVAMSGGLSAQTKDDDGQPNRLVQSLLVDVAAQGDQRQGEAAATSAWDAAYAAYLTAKAETDAAQEDRAVDDDGDFYDRENAAQEAVLLTPAPHAEAVSVKLSFIGEFKQITQGEFLTPEIARKMVERGNNWTDRCLAAAYLDLQRLTVPNEPASDQAWDAAVAALEHATAEDDRLLDVLEEAVDAVERDAPVPEILKREGGGHYTSEDQIAAAKLPFDQKVVMVAALREWLPVREATAAEHRTEEKNDAWSNHSVSLAEDAVIRTPAPNSAALALKLGLVISRQAGVAFVELQTVERMSRLLSSSEPEERDLAVTYQDALRLAGLRPDLVAAQAFDVEGWIAAFEAHPGHLVTREGRLEYQEPKAFGADTPTYEDLLVTEPEAIARFDAYQRSHFTDDQWEAMQADRKRMGWRPLEGGNPFIVQDLSQLDAAYPDGGAEYDRLKALWDLRRERLGQCSPTGAHLWRDLADWQKEAVREFCRTHPAQFIDGYRWTPEGWVAAAKDAGGTFHQGDDGGFFAGFACPPLFFAERLMRALDDEELRNGVADVLRAKRGRP